MQISRYGEVDISNTVIENRGERKKREGEREREREREGGKRER